MKKILIILLSFIILFFSFTNSFTNSTNCNPDLNWDFNIWEQLNNCLKDTKLVNWKDSEISKWWFWGIITNWTNNIALYLWILSVFSIVYWALIMTISGWEDEKITKAKDIIKWWLIWFIWIISASAVINLLVKIIYSL